MAPSALFRTARALEALNVAAVGLSLGALVATVFPLFDNHTGAVSGASSMVFGAIWARWVRSRRTLRKTRIRVGWIASIPLAAMNAGVAYGVACVLGGWDSSAPATLLWFVFGLLVGATVGAIVWIPLLLATLVVFGLPIARAQHLAARGFAGEERGEVVVGLASAFVGLGSALFRVSVSLRLHDWRDVASTSMTMAGFLAAVLGVTAAGLAWTREAGRRRFVARVEAGLVPDYRLEQNGDGRVLVHVAAPAVGYRVANLDEAIADLGEEREVLRLKRAG